MYKNTLVILAAIVLLNFCPKNVSFAIDSAELNNVYPDYAAEFCGKDTCEKFNRKLFVFNLKLNKYLLKPVNTVWASVLPKYGMDRLQSAYNNINYPVRLVSCILQKDFKTSKTETIRFLTNTTLGFGGLYDPALKRFKIQECQEDMEQALAHLKIKSGPYLVLPVVRGNVRDLVGQLFDSALKPTSYIGGFGTAISAMLEVNNSTYDQPMIKKLESSFADPYVIAKKLDGIERYIKNSNLDRDDVLKKNTATQNIIKVSDISSEGNVKADVELPNFNSQGALTDSIRTSFFDNQKMDKSIWSEMSVWNRNFNKKLKMASVNIYPDRANYQYRYILQKENAQNAPIAILYPSIGENIFADESVVMAQILYKEGYSVLIQGSAFEYNFIKSMPKDYRPGLPAQDARFLRLTTSKILEKLQAKNDCKFNQKIIVGSSFGAMTGLFVTAQDEDEKINGGKYLNISKCIAINPPIEIFYALKQLDKFSEDWKNDQSDLKLRTAITAEKVKRFSNDINQKELEKMPTTLPFTDEESKQIITFIMEEKLYNVAFAIENCSKSKKNGLSETVNKMSFKDYAQKYLTINLKETNSTINPDSSLYSIKDFLQNSDNYKIYQTKDDYFTNQEQLNWLKQQSNSKTTIFSNGSHLGCLYRNEFINDFKKELKLQTEDTNQQQAPIPNGL